MAEETTETQTEESTEDDSVEEVSPTPAQLRAFSQRLSSAREKDTAKISQLERDLQSEREGRIRLDEQTKSSQPKETYSRAELLSMVDDGQLSQLKADSLWESQIEKNVTEKVLQQVESSNANSRVGRELDRYIEIVPDLMKDGSEDRAKVATEFSYLVGHGSPGDQSTQLAALRTVYGSIEKLSKKSTQHVGTHQETGGGLKPEPKTEKGLLKTLSSREKAHYEKGIEKGLYKGWDDVEKELEYANPSVRKRMGAKIG